MAEIASTQTLAEQLPEEERKDFLRIAEAYGTGRPELVPQIARLFAAARSADETSKDAASRLARLKRSARFLISHDNARRNARGAEQRPVRVRVAEALLEGKEVPVEILEKQAGLSEMARFGMSELLRHTASPGEGRELTTIPIAEMEDSELRAFADAEVMSLIVGKNLESLEERLQAQGQTVEMWIEDSREERRKALLNGRAKAQRAQGLAPSAATPTSDATGIPQSETKTEGRANTSEGAQEDKLPTAAPKSPSSSASAPKARRTEEARERQTLYRWQEEVLDEITQAFPQDKALREHLLDYLHTGSVENAEGVAAIEKVLRLRDVARFIQAEKADGGLSEESRADRASMAQRIISGEAVSREDMSSVPGLAEARKFGVQGIIEHYANNEPLDLSVDIRPEQLDAKVLENAVDSGVIQWYRDLKNGPDAKNKDLFGGDIQKWILQKRRDYRAVIRTALEELMVHRLPELPEPARSKTISGTEQRVKEVVEQAASSSEITNEAPGMEVDAPEESEDSAPSLFDGIDKPPQKGSR